MNKKIICCFVFTIIISVLVISSFSVKKETTFLLPQEIKKYTVKVKDEVSNNINEIDLEKYVIGVVAAEMPASFESESLKAQAVAARTYALYKKQFNNEYDVYNSTKDQAYIEENEMQLKWGKSFETYYQKIKEAVNETNNQIMIYNEEIIKPFYFAISNGYTETSQAVFNEELPYYQSIKSSWDEETPKFINEVVISKSSFCLELKIDCQNIIISNITKDNSGRISSLTINNKLFSGIKIRDLFKLKSTDFEIKINQDMTFITKGYGHGVGMSQYGANGMAKEGSSYKEILKYYYKNIEIIDYKEV